MIRHAAVAGQFYSASCEEINEHIAAFNQLLDVGLQSRNVLDYDTRLIISPHAGYVYSGFTANAAHRILGNSKVKRVLVIGPSHRVFIKGASISLHDTYETPCGDIDMDVAYAQKLQQRYHLRFQEDAHHEHSTETQVPFIKHYIPEAKVCEIVYGDASYDMLSELIIEVLADKDNAVVISTDLSHFYTLEQARTLDTSCLEAIVALDIEKIEKGPCQACGNIGVMAAIKAAKKLNLRAKILDYRTSADASHDETNVVGYVSAIFS